MISGSTPRGTLHDHPAGRQEPAGRQRSQLSAQGQGSASSPAHREHAPPSSRSCELYLNSIELGRNAGGVEAASRAYFGKELDKLSLPQMAYLAILPKGPSNYDPERHTHARSIAAQLGARTDARQRLHRPGPARPLRWRRRLGTDAAPDAASSNASAAISSRRCAAS